MPVEYGLSAFYGNAYLLQSAQSLWHACIATKKTYPLPAHEANATLYSALAAEAYINTALDLTLGRDEAKALQFAPPAERWLAGPRVIAGHTVLESGSEPHQTLVAVFRERNRLAHARSIRFGWDVEPELREATHVELPVVARYVLRVSQAVQELSQLTPELESLGLVPGGLLKLQAQLVKFDKVRHADDLRLVVRKLRVKLAEEEFGTLQEWVEEFDEPAEDAWWTRVDDIDEVLPDP